MSIELNNESGVAVDEAALQRLAIFALDYLHVHPDADLAILLVDEAAMEQLHVQWMDEPGPTDVLSFPMDELRPGSEDDMTPSRAARRHRALPAGRDRPGRDRRALDARRASAADRPRHPASPRLRSRGARRGEGDVRHPARHPRGLLGRRATAGSADDRGLHRRRGAVGRLRRPARGGRLRPDGSEPHRSRRPRGASPGEAVAARDLGRHRRPRQRDQLHARRLGDDGRRARDSRLRRGLRRLVVGAARERRSS